MRTVTAGLRALRRSPWAIAPLCGEGLIAAILVATGAFRATSSSVASTAVFPLDVFFDLKQSIAYAPGWLYLIAALAVGVLVRSGVLAGTLWMAGDREGDFVAAWLAAAKLALSAVAAFVPSATLFFIAVAIRYAPFVWIAAVLGFVPAVLFARRALRLDIGKGVTRQEPVPEYGTFLGYAYLLALFGAAMTVLSHQSAVLSALILIFVGPLNALFLLGWREHVEAGTYPGGGTLAVTVTVVIVGLLFFLTTYDRYIRAPAPVARATGRGTLFVLQGADSTSATGALSHTDPRAFGFRRARTVLLSYTSDPAYTMADTHRDLDAEAMIVSAQIAGHDPPREFLGHSNGGLILDRILADGLTAPDRAVELAPPPPYPPPVHLPHPNEDGVGRAGADLSRAVAWLFDHVGLQPFDVDAPAAPAQLSRVVARQAGVPRLAQWALGDSVWLDGDWRRPGERNVVVISDHVGITNDARATNVARDFFAGTSVPDDSSSWRGVLVSTLSYAFAPWRP
ncbi:MAG: hypothetical protein M3290_00105 [Actinomycetota bacterium]|nr:hypothetical protein [Actinomycetota bacterium]